MALPLPTRFPRLTPRAWAVAACAAALLTLGWWSGRVEPWLGGWFLAALLAAAWLLHAGSARTARGGQTGRAVTGERRAGTQLRVRVFGTDGPLGPGLESRTGLGEAPLAGGGDELRYAFTPASRGVYRLGPYLRESRDVMGLSVLITPADEASAVSVLPASGTPLWPAGLGEARASLGTRTQDGTPDVLTRPYRDGDPLRRIHWPVSARRGKLMVRPDTDEEQQRPPIVVVDRRKEHYVGATVRIPRADGEGLSRRDFEAALVTADALVEALRNDGSLGASLSFDPPLTGLADVDPLAAALPSARLGRMPDARADLVVIITGRPGPSAAAWVRDISAPRVLVLVHSAEPVPAEVAASWRSAGWAWDSVGAQGGDRA